LTTDTKIRNVIEVSESSINIPDFVKGDLCADLSYIASRH
ncbi:unnamed protein product, partial [marine sediment metagenome]